MIKKIIKMFSPKFLLGWYHYALSFFGALFYGFPSRKIKVIGITGTNGKTTTANLAAAILEEAGYKVAVASSIKFKIGNEEKENKLKMTMPGRAVLQKFLRDAVRAGCQYAIIEATSEGVLQHRHRFIKWQIMVFTNLSAEHIERHKGFANYRAAKGEYFKKCKGTHIVNLDDENIEYFLKFPAIQKFGYGLGIFNGSALLATLSLPKGFQFPNVDNKNVDNKNNDVHITSSLRSDEVICPKEFLKAENVQEEKGGLYFTIKGLGFYLSLIGKFNVYNALAAICVGLSQNVSLEVCQKVLAKAGGVPGRMEEVIKEPFRVIVDYAFTPNALEQVYQTLQTTNYQLQTNLICVLGACGGGRDKWKRPVLGGIAAKYCDEIIITNEDPYDENPMDIVNQVAEGVEGVLKILDRREAIRKALELARAGDTVVITGKGCEPWICEANGKKIPWDDRQVVREELQKIHKE